MGDYCGQGFTGDTGRDRETGDTAEEMRGESLRKQIRRYKLDRQTETDDAAA
jgi:hypothetical protein